MTFSESDLRFEYMRGTGPGGQHKNKTDTAVRVTHLPTGVQAYCDCRSQAQSKKRAVAALGRKLGNLHQIARDQRKKQRRDEAIHNTPIIRTYDFKKSKVKDHRTKKSASLKEVLRKGRIELLR